MNCPKCGTKMISQRFLNEEDNGQFPDKECWKCGTYILAPFVPRGRKFNKHQMSDDHLRKTRLGLEKARRNKAILKHKATAT